MTETSKTHNGLISLQDSHVLVFGGSSGIGLATALQAHTAGARVTILGSNPDRTRTVAEQRGFHAWRAADITNPEAIKQALSDVDAVDHLVLLAGSFKLGKVLESDLDILQLPFQERIWGAIHVLRALDDKLTENASVTLCSGGLTHRPDGNGTAVVAAACAAIEVLGRGLALELAPRRVNTISPGPIDTPLLNKAMGDDGRNAFVEATSAAHPLGRMGTADETAAGVVFLMTNTYMNGAVLHIDGGSRL